jgi:hypothetical protein
MWKPILRMTVVVVIVAIGSPAFAGVRSYRGETSAGTNIGFRIRVADGRMSLRTLRYRAVLTCEDTSTFEYWSAWTFGGGVPLAGRRLSLHEQFGSDALHVEGRFRGRTADGTFRNSQAWLTEDEQAMLCTTGDLTWAAARLGLAGDGRPDGPADRVVRRDGVTVRVWIAA